jgi:outer membrane protein OmpA-like peptidoglycan-associated protein
MVKVKKTILLHLFAAMWLPAFSQKTTDTLKLYFDLGIPSLTKTAAAQIDKWVYNDIITPGKDILIVGYADYLGGNDYNEQLSQNRANNVERYLIGMGIDKRHIKMLVGRGEVDRPVTKAGGYPTDRRVDIVLLGSSKTAKTPVTQKPALPKTIPETKISVAKPGETFVLDNIYFYSGRHYIREESLPELDKLFRALNNNPNVKIQIEGHVCCVAKNRDALDEDTFEMSLSENRAKYIYQYLVKRGISRDRLRYRGFGKSRPLVEKELTVADENKNRRVEIRVLEN